MLHQKSIHFGVIKPPQEVLTPIALRCHLPRKLSPEPGWDVVAVCRSLLSGGNSSGGGGSAQESPTLPPRGRRLGTTPSRRKRRCCGRWQTRWPRRRRACRCQRVWPELNRDPRTPMVGGGWRGPLPPPPLPVLPSAILRSKFYLQTAIYNL